MVVVTDVPIHELAGMVAVDVPLIVSCVALDH